MELISSWSCFDYMYRVWDSKEAPPDQGESLPNYAEDASLINYLHFAPENVYTG